MLNEGIPVHIHMEIAWCMCAHVSKRWHDKSPLVIILSKIFKAYGCVQKILQ